MPYSNNSYKIVKELYAIKQKNAFDDLTIKKNELSSKIPEFDVLDKEISSLSSQVFLISIKGENVEEEIAKLKVRNAELIKKRDKLLADNNLPKDYLNLKFECEKCSDTGYVGINMCECMKKAIIEEELKSSSLYSLFSTESFDTFSLDFYQGKERVAMTKNLEIIKDYAYNFNSHKDMNLLLVGGTGLGKTHLSTSCAKVIIEQGNSVIYEPAQSLMLTFENQRFGDGDYSDGSTTKYFDCDVLIIDDFGTEISNQFTVSTFYNVINTRLNKKLSTIINTNLNQNELRDRYTDRITSRLFGEFFPLVFLGKDIRQQKLI